MEAWQDISANLWSEPSARRPAGWSWQAAGVSCGRLVPGLSKVSRSPQGHKRIRTKARKCRVLLDFPGYVLFPSAPLPGSHVFSCSCSCFCVCIDFFLLKMAMAPSLCRAFAFRNARLPGEMLPERVVKPLELGGSVLLFRPEGPRESPREAPSGLEGALRA